jgi:hypothetical protein
VHREVKAQVRYAFDAEPGYDSVLTIMPLNGAEVRRSVSGRISRLRRRRLLVVTSFMGAT